MGLGDAYKMPAWYKEIYRNICKTCRRIVTNYSNYICSHLIVCQECSKQSNGLSVRAKPLPDIHVHAVRTKIMYTNIFKQVPNGSQTTSLPHSNTFLKLNGVCRISYSICAYYNFRESNKFQYTRFFNNISTFRKLQMFLFSIDTTEKTLHSLLRFWLNGKCMLINSDYLYSPHRRVWLGRELNTDILPHYISSWKYFQFNYIRLVVFYSPSLRRSIYQQNYYWLSRSLVKVLFF